MGLRGEPEHYTPEEIIDALKRHKGMVYLAAEALGCSHTTVYNYMNKYPEVKAATVKEKGKVLDAVELVLFNAAMRSEPWAVSLMVKTQGKNRGYTERTEITGADGDAINVNVTAASLIEAMQNGAREGEKESEE